MRVNNRALLVVVVEALLGAGLHLTDGAQKLPANFHGPEDLNRPDTVYGSRNYSEMRIPRLVWISFTKAPTESELREHYGHIITLRKRNPLWRIEFADTEYRIRFMKKHFANTSLLSVFLNINPALGVIQSDIWR
jgi:hypothetical protein